MPAWCHASPSSPPPRSPGIATWPPSSHHVGDERAPRRRLGDVEAAVAGEQRRRALVDRRAGCVHEQHRHRGAVGRRVAHLAARSPRRCVGPGSVVSATGVGVGSPGGDGVGPGERRVRRRRRGPGALGWLARPVTADRPPVTSVTSPTWRAGRLVVVERRHAGAGAQHQQVVAGGGEAGEDVVALGARGRPTARARGRRGARRPAGPWARRGWWCRRAARDRASTSSQVSASTPSMTVVQRSVPRSRRCTSVWLQPRSTCTSSQRPSLDSETSGHASLSGRSVKHGSSGAGVVAEAVPPDRAVVAGLLVADLGGVGVAGVGEAGAVGQPGHRRGAGVGDGVGAGARRSPRRAPGACERSSPPVEVPKATSAPSGDGWYQSMADVTSPDASAGSMSTRPGPSTGAAIGRTTSAARSRSPQRSIVNSWSPRTAGDRAVPAAVSSASRSRNRPRAGTASRAARVRSFWAVVHARTSAEVPSSSQRYGSATSMPWRTSVGPSARVAGGGGTSAQGVALRVAAAVGLAAVVGLLLASPVGGLLRALRHREATLPAAVSRSASSRASGRVERPRGRRHVGVALRRSSSSMPTHSVGVRLVLGTRMVERRGRTAASTLASPLAPTRSASTPVTSSPGRRPSIVARVDAPCSRRASAPAPM